MKFSPFKQNTDHCALFIEYCERNGVPLNFEFEHSELSFFAYQKALSNFFREPPVLGDRERDCLYISKSWMERAFWPLMCHSGILSLDEALGKLNLSTSPGPVWRSQWKSKRDAIAGLGLQFFHDHWENLSEPESWNTYWGGNLKDELRPWQKVLDHKTRLFLISPVEHAIALERMCWDMNQKLMFFGKRMQCASSVGVDFFRRFFDTLYRISLGFDETDFTDVSKYDTSIFSELLWDICDFRKSCLRSDSPLDHQRMDNLYRDIVDTLIVLQNGVIVQKHGGNPSGQVCTSTDDTLILYRLYAFCWLYAGGPNDYDLFCKEVRLFLFGDDSVVLKKGCGVRYLSRDNIVKGFKALGMDVEFAEKFEFLGHTMCDSPSLGIKVPVLPTEKILSSLAQGGKNDVPRIWERSCNIRISSFTNPEAFKVCDGFCQFLLERFPDLDRRIYIPVTLLRLLHTEKDDDPLLLSREERMQSDEQNNGNELDPCVDEGGPCFRDRRDLRLLGGCAGPENGLQIWESAEGYAISGTANGENFWIPWGKKGDQIFFFHGAEVSPSTQASATTPSEKAEALPQGERQGRTRKRKGRAPSKRPRRAGSQWALSQCAQMYAATLADPFTGPPEACVPNYPALDTKRARIWSETVMTVPASGTGFAMMEPSYFAFNDQITNTAILTRGLVVSTSAYAGTTFSLPGVGSVNVLNNSEYVLTQFGTTAADSNYRVVSAGLRVRYIDTELNRGGQCLALHEPNHQTVIGMDIGTVAGYQEHRRFPVNRDWIVCLWKPVDVQDTEMQGTFPTTTPTSYPMGIIMSAPGAVQVDMEVQAFVNLEFSGRNIRGKSPSHFDATGFASVHGASAKATFNVPHTSKGTAPESVARQKSAIHEANEHGKTTQSGWQTFTNIVEKAVPIVGQVLSWL